MPTVRSKPKRKLDKTGRKRSEERPSASEAKKTFVLGVLLVILTLAVYFPVSSHPFVNYDDGFYVISNDHVKHGLDWETVDWALTTYDQANWHPLTWLSHALDWQLFGPNPAGHHVTNLLLHMANVLLLFWVMRQATGFLGRSFMVAVLFALHPINVESVAWIAERKNLLSMLFFLLALEAYRRYVRDPRAGRYAVVAVCYALGLMAKPQVITLPFVLLLWDYWPLQKLIVTGERPISAPAVAAGMTARNFSVLLKEKLPLFALCAASAVITFTAQRAGGAMNDVYHQPFSIRVENAIVSYVRYLGKAFWPSHLAPLYPHPGNSLRIWQAVAALVLLAAITTLVAWHRRRRYLVVGWLWFLGTLVPMIGLVQVGGQAMADRYAYLPFIGLFIMVCWGIADWAQQRRIPTLWLAGASAAVLLALAVVAHRQLDYWGDNVTLWSHTLQVTLPNYIAEDNLAQLLMDQGQTEQAMQHFRAAAAIYPGDTTSNTQIAMYEQRSGRLPEVVEQYDKLIKMTSDPVQRAEMFTNQGYAYGGLKDYARARESFQAAVDLNPNQARAWMGLGVVAQRAGDLNHAIDDYEHSIKAHPTDVAYVLLARALEQNGRNGEAQTALQTAKLLSADFERAQRVATDLVAH